ncbi:bifunctional response regulator/alkaline phosphatase family protein [candidate division WOR-3 bacterium]|nr:bifunctional response regulator/alkaline phosphatase family protein [candidate division WOR-3 bacterium]
MNILWIDDEIDLLRPLIMLLKERSYNVTGVSSGEDGVSLLKRFPYDLVLLDQIMPGKDGIMTLRDIRDLNMDIPVVMITKSEDEELIDKAYGVKATDYLLKPIKPQQLISTVKRILERANIIRKAQPELYAKFYTSCNNKIYSKIEIEEWISIYLDIVHWDMELYKFGDEEFRKSHRELLWTAERQFARFIETEYPRWLLEGKGPDLSPDIVRKYVMPRVERGNRVYFIILDCMRYDQWLVIRSILNKDFKIQEAQYLSILPTATPYARNSIFAGVFPDEIAYRFPKMWDPRENRFERDLLAMQVEEIKRIKGPVYFKVRNLKEAEDFKEKVRGYRKAKFVAVVINFLDLLIHHRMESAVLEEVLSDENALRDLTGTWFTTSSIYSLLQELKTKNTVVIITTDHGAIIAKKPSLIEGGRTISKNLRYKYGPVVEPNKRDCIFIEEPGLFRLPGKGINYAIAKEDYYFIYQSHAEEYKKEYKYTFQHGGVSMQEQILPIAVLTPR